MIEAGANALVAGSAVFGAPDYSEGKMHHALLSALLIIATSTCARKCSAVAIVPGCCVIKSPCKLIHSFLPMHMDRHVCCILQHLRFTASRHGHMTLLV